MKVYTTHYLELLKHCCYHFGKDGNIQLLQNQTAPNAILSQGPVTLQVCKESVDNLHSLELFHVDNTKLKEEMTLLNEEKEFRRYLDFL